MHCIIKRENHPDRAIDEVIGPFATRDAADAEITLLVAEDAQWYKGFRPYEYFAWPMEAPTTR